MPVLHALLPHCLITSCKGELANLLAYSLVLRILISIFLISSRRIITVIAVRIGLLSDIRKRTGVHGGRQAICYLFLALSSLLRYNMSSGSRMPFMGDSRRRQLRRLSTRSNTSSTKTDGSQSDATPDTPKTSKSLKHSGTKQSTAKAVAVLPRSIPQSPRKNTVNVFAFMEEDEQGIDVPQEQHIAEEVPDLSSSPDSSSSTSSRSNLQSPYSDLEVHGVESRAGYLWCDGLHKRGHSMHSDSGVSMLSSSLADESPVWGYKSRFAALKESTPTASQHTVTDSLTSTSIPGVSIPHLSHVPSLDMRYVEEPERYYVPSPAVPARTPDYHLPQGLQPTLPHSPYGSSHGSVHAQRPPEPELKKSGYDLLASSISSRPNALLTPIYRKFETLNNRILLYLQDEISEMEEGLKELDNAITQEEGYRTASRRSDPMYPSQLKWQRQDLMCRIFSKVEQYSWSIARKMSMVEY